MTTPIILQTPTSRKVNGVITKSYTDTGKPFLCNFATYGGTEITTNNVIAVEDTAEVVTWFNPDITADCRIKRLSDNAEFEILGTPENIEMRNMFCTFKVKRVRGGA